MLAKHLMALAMIAAAILLVPGRADAAVDDHANDRAVLRQLKDVYETAVAQGNADLLTPYLADDFTGVVATNEAISGADGLKAYWKKIRDLIGPAGKVQTTVSYEPSTIAGDFAISRGQSQNIITTSAGRTFHYASNWTALSRRQDGQWKLVRIHDSIDPLSNEFVEMAMQGDRIKTASIAGISALIFGLIVGRLSKRLNDRSSSKTASGGEAA